MKGRVPLVLSITAVVIAVVGFTSLGQAARDALPRARFALNAGKVDGLNASRTPKAGYLLALGRNKKFPASVIGTGPAGPPGVSGLEIASAATAEDSSSPKSVTLNCAAGKRVIGGGAAATGAATTVAITQAYPSSTTQWIAAARETTGTGASWKLTAYALCAIAS